MTDKCSCGGVLRVEGGAYAGYVAFRCVECHLLIWPKPEDTLDLDAHRRPWAREFDTDAWENEPSYGTRRPLGWQPVEVTR